jgi:type I restriction enzyme S subunit
MEVKPGYKRTEVGVIPEEWEVTTIGKSLRLVNGRAFKPQDWKDSGTPIIRIQNLNDPNGEYNYCATLVEERHRVRNGDVLFAWSGTTGTSFGARIWHGPTGVLNQHIFKVHADPKKLTSVYSYLILQRVQEDIEKQAHGFKASFVHVKKSDLVKIALPVPRLPEQRAIAEALSNVDELLGGLNRLIAKKRDLKQTAMQQLLTGQTRLPGFHSKWRETDLGALGQFLKGRGVTKDQARSGNLACVRYGELYTHHNDVVHEFRSWISSEVASTAMRLRKGDILFAGSGETKEEIGKCAAFVSDAEAYAGGDIVILRPRDVDAVFLGYFLNTASIKGQKASRGQGDAVVHISSAALAAIRCRLPTLDEQTAIAQVLTEMDAELVALEQRREKTRALKQGMMQELLTGKTRLV